MSEKAAGQLSHSQVESILCRSSEQGELEAHMQTNICSVGRVIETW